MAVKFTYTLRNTVKVDKDKYNKRLAGMGVSIGFKGSSVHEGMSGKDNITNVYLSYIHEVGDPVNNIPPRPFMLQALRAVNANRRIINLSQRKDVTLETMELLVKRLVREMKKYVKSGKVTPALKQETIERRQRKASQFGYPLVSDSSPIYETGELIDALKGWITNRGSSK